MLPLCLILAGNCHFLFFPRRHRLYVLPLPHFSQWVPSWCSPIASLQSINISWRGAFTCVWCPWFCLPHRRHPLVTSRGACDPESHGTVQPERQFLAGCLSWGTAQTADQNTLQSFCQKGLLAYAYSRALV